ncbi:D-alanyl-D-alanine carboxypeptidase family protein [Streptomyces tubercidicus]|uniref:D-alanyl-D-alanine carboxypeptidase family protein n=1 Tax=Streptomyces tubercidicus TaxID=47759 RepID=UPI00378743EA
MPDAAKDRYKKPMYTRRQFVGIATGVGTTLALVAVSAAFGKAGAQRKTYTSQQELVEAKNAISEILSSSDPVKTAAWIVGTGDAPTSVKTEMDQQLDALTQAVAAGTGAKDPASIVVSRTRDAATQRRIWDRKYDFLRRGDGGAGTFGTITEESRGQYGDTLGAGIQWDPDNEAHRIVWSSLTPEQRQIEILQTSTAPGVSQHHSGAAADLFSTEPNDWSNNGPLAAQYTWLSRNAARYGFIQTYTASSAKDQPAVSAEPWHWAYAPVSEAILDFIRADPSTIRGQLENLWNYAPGRYTYIHENWQNYVFHVNERAHFA